VVGPHHLRTAVDVTRVAAIDCGTNAVRLLVSDVESNGRMTDRFRLMRIVRLGEGVDRTGAFSPAALDRTFVALDEYASIIADEGVERVRFVATSASRDVSNRRDFEEGVEQRIGILPEIISGAQEAELSFAGALLGLPAGRAALPALVVDIGGGSTEFVLGSAEPESAASVDIGCVRMTERHLHSDPPSPVEVAAALVDIEAAVADAMRQVPAARARSLVGLAGTVTTVAAMVLDLPEYDAAVLHGTEITRADVAAATTTLLGMARSERAVLPYMHPGRVDVIAGGAMILLAVMMAGEFVTVLVSETDILDGIVYSLRG
jgi:exopolyphosphatase/guanosine-5'-triphosphate,3'-diphosphate pyrophosphatase